MFERTKRSWTMPAVCVAITFATACAKGGKGSETAERMEAASGEMAQAETLRATIEAVDVEDRVIGLRDEEGHPFVVEVGEGEAIERMHPGQKVKVTYQESVAFTLEDPNSPEAKAVETVVEQESRRRIPDGVQFGRRVKTTVQIIEIAAEGATATFRVPEGDVRTVAVDDPANRKKIANLRPGDAVAVTYTEKLAVGIDE